MPCGVNGYRVETPLVARVAGLPASVFRGLRLEESWDCLAELLDLETQLATESELLANTLFESIGQLTEPAVKPRAVALRRAIHQIRTPAKGEWNAHVADALPAEITHSVQRWLRLLRDRDERRAQLPELLSHEVAHKQESLRQATADPLFQHALSQASPSLFEELRKWQADGERGPRRRTLLGLAKFLSRAAAKTSPYSTFMTSVLGTWREHGPPVSFTGDFTVRGVVELDRKVVARLVRALTDRAPVAEHIRVRPNPSALVVRGAVNFIGPPPEEPIITLAASSALEECLRAADLDADRTVTELCTSLATETGADPDGVRRFVDQLVKIGLLERLSPFPDQSGRPLDELLAWLRAVNAADAGCAEAMDLIDRLRTHLRGPLDPADADGYRAMQESVAHTVSSLETTLGLPPTGVDRLRKTAFHESSWAPDAQLECSLPQWRPALDDLDVVRRWLALRNAQLPTRLILSSYLGNRFGKGASVPFLALHRAIQEDLSSPEERCAPWLAALRPFLQLSTPVWPTQLEHCEDPRLRELYRLWRESAEAILPGWQDGGVIRVDPEILAMQVERWPEWVRPEASVTCYLQPYLARDQVRLVLNIMAGGYGRGRSRWLRLAAQAGAEPAEPSRSASADPVVAELSGTFDASVNLRTPLAPFEIDYPFTTSDRPAGERIPLNDLEVFHDADGDEVLLFSARLGLQVRPVHLGMMGDPLLPPAARVLLAAFGPSHLVHPAIPTVYRAEDTDMTTALTRSPRIEVGSVTLQRARWSVPAGEVPVRQAGAGDADYLARLVGWLRSSGIPERCYVRVIELEAEWRTQLFAKSRKPMFIDFANFFLVLAFEHLLKERTGLVIFEEALPPPGGGCSPGLADPHVTEFIVELSADGA